MKWFAVAVVSITSFVVTMAKPEILAENSFLKALISHELVSILVVILTVTMASVANIHLALGKLNKKLSDSGVDISGNIGQARKELSENAWYLFGSFCVLIIVLIAKGSVDSQFWISAANSAALVILTLNLAILYDIYVSVYMLTSLDESPHPGQNGDDGSDIGGGNDQ